MESPENFKSKRKYRIWMYTVSHSTLILRSEKQHFDVDYEFQYDDPTISIDIIFTGVDFISIPDSFNQIEISKEGGKFTFNGNENCYIKASHCTVGIYGGDEENNVLNLRYDEIIEL